MMAKKNFPDYLEKHLHDSFTPMVLTARLLKEHHPECKIAFIGPCLSKKQEVAAALSRVMSTSVSPLKSSEVCSSPGMLILQNFRRMNRCTRLVRTAADSRRAAASPRLLSITSKKIDPDREVKVEQADGLANCKKMMMIATKTHKYDGYLLEGKGAPEDVLPAQVSFSRLKSP